MRLGRARHVEHVLGDVRAARELYRALRRDLPEDHALRADVCFGLFGACLKLGDVAGATEPFRELKDRHGRADVSARAEALILGALAPWGEVPDGRPVVRRAALPLDMPGRHFAIATGPGLRVELGQRLAVVRDERRVGKALVTFVGRTLGVATILEGEVAAGDVVPLAGAPGLGAEPVDASALLAEARRLLAEIGVGASVAAEPAALGLGTAAPAPPPGRYLEVRVLAAEAAYLGGTGLSFEGLETGAVAAAHPAGAGGLGESAPALAAVLSPEELAALLERLERDAGPRKDLAVLRRFARVDIDPGATRELIVGTRRLPIGEDAPRFEGLVARLTRLAALPGHPKEVALDVEAWARDIPATAVPYPGRTGALQARTASTQRIHGRVHLRAEAPAVLLGGLTDPFATPRAGQPARQALVLIVWRDGAPAGDAGTLPGVGVGSEAATAERPPAPEPASQPPVAPGADAPPGATPASGAAGQRP